MAVNFSPDVVSILTTKGCNGSGCHGSPAGQNGFKLSLFGYDIGADHQMIVQGHDGRRVDLEHPEQSLLLRKPTFQVAHGGGRLFDVDSEEYETISSWLQSGAPLDAAGFAWKSWSFIRRRGFLRDSAPASVWWRWGAFPTERPAT